MNYFEIEIAKLDKRVKKIKANPDPAKLKCNEMLYELERDLNIHRLEQWKAEKPFADGIYPALLKAMGFESYTLDMLADRSQLVSSHFDEIRKQGLPEHACDRTTVLIAMCLKKELPLPNFLVSTNRSCDPIRLAVNALGRMLDIPVRCIDHGLEATNETLQYVTDQLGEIIEFAEKTIPGIKYDESKLLEAQEFDRLGFDYLHQIYELRKRVPCPLAGIDAFRIPLPPSHYHEPERALEYFKAWHDEMYERAEKGFGAVENERLRVLWAVSGPFYANPFALLEKRGVSIPWFQFDAAARFSGIIYGYYGDEKEYGRKLS
ncbi:MAG: 2-hydroxyacyl-CoA dehydratase family protein, partial [Desulfatiglandales bacterium]|nr:2-hydroxyacyl-CoA dehydratase family protein [Desulfatiglandales bacterium]